MEIARLDIKRKYLGVILVLIVLFLAPLFATDFILFVAAIFMINMLWASATWAIFHQAGQALFAVAMIAGIGGYTTALLGGAISNTWITTVIALFACSAVGMLFYLLATRVIGHIHFGILNLGFIFVFRYLIVALTNVTNGIDGLKLRYFSPESFFAAISRRYMVVLCITLVCLFAIHKLMSSRFGRVITLVGRNPQLAASMGINTDKYIKRAYLLFTPFIGLGGILYSHFIGHISPETWNPDLSLLIIFATLIGGASNILGPIVGSIIATGIPISFDITMEFRFGIVGIVAILIFLFKPQGIVGWIKDIIHQNRKNGVIAS